MMAHGTERHPAEAWLVLAFDVPATVLELVQEHLGPPAAKSLTRLLPSPPTAPVESTVTVPEVMPRAAEAVTWYLDLQAPATVGYTWFPAAHTLVGRVKDADAVARHLGAQMVGEDPARTVGGIRLFPLGPVVGALRDEWLVVADDVEMAFRLAGTLTAGQPALAPRRHAGARTETMDGTALPLRVDIRLHQARQAVAPLLADRQVDDIDTWPVEGPVSRQHLAIGALLHRLPAQVTLLSLEAFVTPTALVLKSATAGHCPTAARLPSTGESTREQLVLTGAGSAFHAAVRSLPFVVAALDIAQDTGSMVSRRAVLDIIATAGPGRAFRVAVRRDGHWHVGPPTEPFLTWTTDGFVLEWAGVRLVHDAIPGAGGPCVSLTPAGLESVAARLNPRPAAPRHR